MPSATPASRNDAVTPADLTYAWADWSVRYCLPLLLDHLGEPALAERARDLTPVRDATSAGIAFSMVREIHEELRAVTDDAASSALLVAQLSVAQLQETAGDVGWILSRARYDANRLAEHCRAAGLTNVDVDEVFLEQPEWPPRSQN